jgi:ribosomal protein L37AE/L43A
MKKRACSVSKSKRWKDGKLMRSYYPPCPRCASADTDAMRRDFYYCRSCHLEWDSDIGTPEED